MRQVHRAPWAEFPDVILHTNGAKLKAHASYAAAKAGDPASALEVAEALIRPDKVNLDFDVIVPVIQTDAAKHNALPRAAAFILAIKLNRQALLNTYQTNEVSHTKADAAIRILAQPHFAGVVEPGLRVLLLDDVVTFGSTIANLRGWLEHCGAHVVGCTSLASGFASTKLVPPADLLDRLNKRHPNHAELAHTFGFNQSCWTNREARFLLERSDDQFQGLITAARTLYPSREALINPETQPRQGRGRTFESPGRGRPDERPPDPPQR